MTQPQRSNPLYSPFGCGSALLLVIVLVALIYTQGGKMFSPGELTAIHPQETMLGDVTSHADIGGDCGQCHDSWNGVTTERCENCHLSITQQRQEKSGLHGRFTNSKTCRGCHTDHKGSDANITALALDDFDHANAIGFSLVKHQDDIVCQDCHMNGRYSHKHLDCVTCHAEIDKPFMTEHTTLFGNTCLDCHDGIDQMTDFDHADIFPLEEAHATIDCFDCHKEKQFTGLPSDCVDCHAEPEVHFGQFGIDCERCHTTGAWTPAQLMQHTFPINHESHNDIECVTCHERTYAEYTCYGCHEHTVANIRSEHREEGITDFENCIECHPTGQEDEAEDD